MKLKYKFLLKMTNFVFPSKIIGKEKIPEGGAIILYNHLSLLDPFFVLKAYGKEDINILAKIELFKNKFLGKALKAYGGIPISREKPEIQALFKATKMLKEGHKLGISPEGTRNKTGSTELLPFKGGVVVLGVKAKCPIVPFIVEKKARPFRKTKVYIGEPFELSEFYDKKLDEADMDNLTQIVRGKMVETQQTLFSLKKGKKSKK